VAGPQRKGSRAGQIKAAVTSFDVARVAQVSQSAVSRTFTPGASVSDATRRRVLEAARKLGYRPNAHARSLITRRSRIIGLVLSYLENLFYPGALQRLAERLQADGYHVLLFVNDTPNADDLVTEILRYHVDGTLPRRRRSSTSRLRCRQRGVVDQLGAGARFPRGPDRARPADLGPWRR